METGAAAAALFGALVLLMAVSIGPMRADAAPEFDVEVHNDIEYYDPDTPTENGNKLDLYVPEVPGNPTLPLVIWSSGSAWLGDCASTPVITTWTRTGSPSWGTLQAAG